MSKYNAMSSEDEHLDMLPDYAEASQASSGSRSFQTTFACVSLNMSDRIRLIRFPEHHVMQLQEAIQKDWTKGVQATRVYGVSQELKLKGNPWSSTYWDREKIAARCLMSAVLGELYTMGWLLKASVDLSKKERDKDSLLFRFQQPPPPPCDWMSLSFIRTDKLYILNAPDELRNAIVHALGAMVQRHQDVHGSYELKLSGRPWFPTGEEAVTTRVIALTLLEVLEKHGFSLYASIDQDIGLEGAGTDTWHCCRLKGWNSGQPVYHS